MLPRLSLALGLAFLAALPALCGCSSSHRRDQYYGTDAGANYRIPDAVSFSSAGDADEAGTEAATDDGAAPDPDMAASPDDGAAQDSDPGTDS
jgi:hypothetical protein